MRRLGFEGVGVWLWMGSLVRLDGLGVVVGWCGSMVLVWFKGLGCCGVLGWGFGCGCRTCFGELGCGLTNFLGCGVGLS